MQKQKEKQQTPTKPLLLQIAIPIALSVACFLLSTFATPLIPSRSDTPIEEDDSMNSIDSVSEEESQELVSLNQDEDQEGEENTISTTMQHLESSLQAFVGDQEEGNNISTAMQHLKSPLQAFVSDQEEGNNISTTMQHLESSSQVLLSPNHDGNQEDEGNIISTTMQQLETTREITQHKTHEGPTIEQEIEGLNEIVTALEEKFYDYCHIKEQESSYQKLQIMCLGLKLEALETQNQRLEGSMAEFREAMEQFDIARTEYQSLQRKVKKLSKMNKLYSRRMHQQETYVDPATSIVASSSGPPLLPQLEEIQARWRADMEEMIYLGWISMWLRHELQGEKEEEPKVGAEIRDELVLQKPIEENVEIGTVEIYDSKICVRPKKPRLLHKIKGWAKGKGKSKKECG